MGLRDEAMSAWAEEKARQEQDAEQERSQREAAAREALQQEFHRVLGRQENVTGSTHEVDGITFTLIDRDGPRLAVVLGGQPQEVFDLKHLGQLREEAGGT